MRTVLFAGLLLLATPWGIAQDTPTAFVDCNLRGCDSDYFQTEIAFVRHVRDRADADLYVLVTSESTGGGGSLYTLFFVSQRELAGRHDTLTARVSVSSSHDERRSLLARRIALGFAGLAAETPLADRLRITADAPTTTQEDGAGKQTSDPWNNWVFRIRGNGFFNGQQSTRSANIFGNVTAERVTDAPSSRSASLATTIAATSRSTTQPP